MNCKKLILFAVVSSGPGLLWFVASIDPEGRAPIESQQQLSSVALTFHWMSRTSWPHGDTNLYSDSLTSCLQQRPHMDWKTSIQYSWHCTVLEYKFITFMRIKKSPYSWSRKLKKNVKKFPWNKEQLPNKDLHTIKKEQSGRDELEQRNRSKVVWTKTDSLSLVWGPSTVTCMIEICLHEHKEWISVQTH